MIKKVSVGIADMKITRQEGILITYALGSCIGISFYDPMIKLGGLLHIMLPQKQGTDTNVFKFADSGIPETLRKLQAFGASKSRMVCKIAGGAKMFEIKGGSLSNIGQRNIESVHNTLKREGIKLLQEDVGGTVARTLLFDVGTGLGCVRCYGKPEHIF